jgi:hypothetical protein
LLGLGLERNLDNIGQSLAAPFGTVFVVL